MGASVDWVTDRSAEWTTIRVEAENSEVVPAGSVDVALSTRPATGVASGTLKLALPPASVVTVASPRYVWPSPYPLRLP